VIGIQDELHLTTSTRKLEISESKEKVVSLSGVKGKF